MTTVSLTRLSRREGTTLISGLAQGRALPDEVTNQILVRTDGVPLFIEELTKAVLESGLLRKREHDYVLDGPLAPVAIPTTLHASLMARFDRLASVRQVAQVGAALGRQFSQELLHAAAGMPERQLSDALEQLVSAELLYRRGAGFGLPDGFDNHPFSFSERKVGFGHAGDNLYICRDCQSQYLQL